MLKSSKIFKIKLFHDLLDNIFLLKGAKSPINVAEDFLSMNPFRINYNITYQGDDLYKMSEGKIAFVMLNLQSKCNKKRSTHQLEYNFVSTQKPLPNDEYFLPTSYNKRARKDNDFTRTGQKTSRNCQSTGT